MTITRETLDRAHAAHALPGSSQDFLRGCHSYKDDCPMVEAFLIIAPTGPIHLGAGPVVPGSIAITIPPGLNILDLSMAMWFYPLPALILDVLRTANARGLALSEHERALIRICEAAFLDCVVQRDWVSRFADYVMTSPAWQERHPSRNGPS